MVSRFGQLNSSSTAALVDSSSSLLLFVFAETAYDFIPALPTSANGLTLYRLAIHVYVHARCHLSVS